MTRVRARRPGVRGRRRRGSDQRFAVMADQDETFGLIASVPTCWRLAEIAEGRQRSQARVAAPVNAARQRAWAGIQGPPTGARRRRAAALFPFGHERQAVRLQHPPGRQGHGGEDSDQCADYEPEKALSWWAGVSHGLIFAAALWKAASLDGSPSSFHLSLRFISNQMRPMR
jgi:hypothetical protein